MANTATLGKIGVLTSGGDAPGMNAAVRSVVRTAITSGIEVVGIMQGYSGAIHNKMQPLTMGSVANIIQRGGTILKSGRAPEFLRPDVRTQAAGNLKAAGIEGLVVIGGDCTFNGAHLLAQEHGLRVVVIPGTIDNDIFGTEETIGFDTAINTALEAIDRIRDTALSHNRLFFIEVMGRHSGYIAINSGIAGGAVAVIIPEQDISFDELYSLLEQSGKAHKKSSLIVVAEGSKIGGANELAKMVAERSNYFDIKVTILGHLQRGGSPTYFDRVLASRMGVAAVEGLLKGEKDSMVGIFNNKIVFNQFADIMNGQHHEIDQESLRIAKILSI